MIHTIRFNDALRLAAEGARDPALPAQWPVRIVRDIFGRLRFAVDAYRPSLVTGAMNEDRDAVPPDQIYPADAHRRLVAATARLGRYATAPDALFRDDFANPDSLFKSADWHELVLPEFADADGVMHAELAFNLLDRQIVGQDWLHTHARQRAEGDPPRVVFYGLKGGVGRTTALAMIAYNLAREGRRVLLLDFDLESPGLSALLIPADRVAGYGLVDWFIEDAIYHDDTVLNDLVSDSPLAENTGGRIRVASAIGQGETAYLAKLARVYSDVPTRNGPERFAQRMGRLVKTLEEREKPDIVLIDSRAGLHDLAAISIATLADLALLFATDSEQTWSGYRQLFTHWQQRPAVLRGVRERLWLVRAMFPETDRKERFDRFLEHAYDLFSEQLYDAIDPSETESGDTFSFDMDSESAPHFPLIVNFSARFMEFDPLLPESHGGVGEGEIDLAFGAFTRRVKSLLFGE